jgi:hypothetical protein
VTFRDSPTSELRQARITDGHRLVCVECERRSLPSEPGWRACLGGGYDTGELEIGIYCPECATREFG